MINQVTDTEILKATSVWNWSWRISGISGSNFAKCHVTLLRFCLFDFYLTCFPGSSFKININSSPKFFSYVLSHSVMSDSNPMDCSPPGSSALRDSPRQEYWSGLPCPPPRDLPNPGIKPKSPALQADSLPSETPGKPKFFFTNLLKYPDGIVLSYFILSSFSYIVWFKLTN